MDSGCTSGFAVADTTDSISRRTSSADNVIRPAVRDTAADAAFERPGSRVRSVAAKIENAPLSAKVAIPSRKIDDLPPVLGVPGTEGNVVLDATFEGTLKEPKVTVDGGLGQLSIRDSPLEKPFAVKVLASYDGARALAHVALDQGGKRLFKATADGRVAARRTSKYTTN